MTIGFKKMDLIDVSSVALLQSYVLSPFKVKSTGQLQIPEKYLDVILSLQPEDSEVDWEKIPATTAGTRETQHCPLQSRNLSPQHHH